jgi:mRNA interferase MazF
MNRGDLMTVVAAGDYGKPRPAIVIQSNKIADTDTVLTCLMTSLERDTSEYRLAIPPTNITGLRATSYVMGDKIFAIRRDKCGPVFGRLPDELLAELNDMLAMVVGLAD